MIPIGIYALYFILIPLGLNTPLFAKLTGMQNEELTHIRFLGAYSFFPGHLRSREMRIAIRDQNVRVNIDLRGVKARYSIREFFKKTILVDSMEVREASLSVDMKEASETAEHYAKHSVPEDVIPISEAKHEELKATRWTILAPKLRVERASPLRLGSIEIKGEILVVGGFRLQPGVEAEVFPAYAEFRRAEAGSDLLDLEGRIDARFLPFPIDRIEGNEVFKYATGLVALRGRTENLRILNVTLRKLPGYEFGPSKTNIEAKIGVRSGQMTEKSFFRTSTSEIHFQAPRFELRGTGSVEWHVRKGADACGTRVECGDSRLSVGFPKASALVSIGESGKLRGGASGIRASARIHGTHLTDMFRGVQASLRLKGAALVGTGKGWNLASRWKGHLNALGGILPEAWGVNCSRKSEFEIGAQRFSIRPKGEAPIVGRANVSITLCPLDFRSGEMRFPDVRIQASAKTPAGDPFEISANLTDFLQRSGPAETSLDTWKGKLKFRLAGADSWLQWLQKKGLSGFVATLLRAEVVEGSAEWELAGGRQWARFDDLHSTGLWKAWGTYSAGPDRRLAALEARVAGIPVGVVLLDQKFSYSLFPSESWYPFDAGSFPKLPQPN